MVTNSKLAKTSIMSTTSRFYLIFKHIFMTLWCAVDAVCITRSYIISYHIIYTSYGATPPVLSGASQSELKLYIQNKKIKYRNDTNINNQSVFKNSNQRDE